VETIAVKNGAPHAIRHFKNQSAVFIDIDGQSRHPRDLKLSADLLTGEWLLGFPQYCHYLIFHGFLFLFRSFRRNRLTINNNMVNSFPARLSRSFVTGYISFTLLSPTTKKKYESHILKQFPAPRGLPDPGHQPLYLTNRYAENFRRPVAVAPGRSHDIGNMPIVIFLQAAQRADR